MKWISTKDRLPKYGTWVIGMIEKPLLPEAGFSVHPVVRISTDGTGENWDWAIRSNCGGSSSMSRWDPFNFSVVSWMPLPSAAGGDDAKD